jgi:hypothetical protein
VAGIHGKNASANIGGMSAMVEYSVEIAHAYVDASVYGDSWKYYFQGLPEVNGTFSGMYVGGSIPSSGVMSVSFSHGPSGSAYVDISVSAAVNDAIRVSGRFKGFGPWG